MTLGLTSINEHPLLPKVSGMIPFSINTDDTVVFDISLSNEIQMVADYFHWTKIDVIQFSSNLVSQILETDPTIHKWLSTRIKQFSNESFFVCL